MITLQHIRHILSVAEHQNFTEAAISLNISQSALTASLQKAELLLGVKLFDRTTRKLRLTPFGQTVVYRGRRTLMEAEEIQREIKLLNEVEAGEVSLAMTPAAADSLLGKVMQCMLKKHPNINIHVTVDTWGKSYDDFTDGKHDVYVGVAKRALDVSEQYHVQTLSRQHAWYYCRTQHPILHKENISTQDVLQYQLALPELPEQLKSTFSLDMNSNLMVKHIECNNHAMIRTIVTNSDTIGVASMNMIGKLLNAEKVVPLIKNAPQISWKWEILSSKDRLISPATTALIKCVSEVFTNMEAEELSLREEYGVTHS